MAEGSSVRQTLRVEIPTVIRDAFEADAKAHDAPPRIVLPPRPSPEDAARSLSAYLSQPFHPSARVHWVGAFESYRHPADLYAEMLSDPENLVVVDARYPEAFAREHLPAAISLPTRRIDESSVAGLSRDVRVVVYCWSASCHASGKAADRLRALGFEHVAELYGGLETWRRHGYPTERG